MSFNKTLRDVIKAYPDIIFVHHSEVTKENWDEFKDPTHCIVLDTGKLCRADNVITCRVLFGVSFAESKYSHYYEVALSGG